MAAGAAASVGFGASFASPADGGWSNATCSASTRSCSGTALRLAVQQAFDYYARYYVESFRLPTMSKAAVARPVHDRGLEPGARWAAGRQRCDPRPAAPRRVGVGRSVDDRPGIQDDRGGRGARSSGAVRVVRRSAQGPRHDGGTDRAEGGPGGVEGAARQRDRVPAVRPRPRAHRASRSSSSARRTTLPAGPATLAIRTGAPLLPVGCYFTPRYNGHHAVVRPPVPTVRRGGLRDDVARVTQALARELEFLIRRAPEQWHLFQPNWPSDPGYND